jgi:hypothetical protein
MHGQTRIKFTKVAVKQEDTNMKEMAVELLP